MGDETGGVDGADSGSGSDDRDDGPDISDESREALDGSDNDSDGPLGAGGSDDDDSDAVDGTSDDDGAGEDAEDDDTAAEEAAAAQERLEAEGREVAAHVGEQMGHGPTGEDTDVDADTPDAVTEEEADLEAEKAELTAEIEELAEETLDVHDPTVFSEGVTDLMEETTNPELQEHIAEVAVAEIVEHYQTTNFGDPSYALGDLIEAQTNTGTRDIVADTIVDWSETVYDAGELDPMGTISGSVDGYAGGMTEMPNAREALATAFAERAAGQTGGFADVALDRALELDVVAAARTLPGEAARITEAMTDTLNFGAQHSDLSRDLYEAIDEGLIVGADARGLIEGTLDHTIAQDDLSGLLDTVWGGSSYRDALAGAMATAYDVGAPETAEYRQTIAEGAINASFDAYLEANPTTRMQLAAAWNNPGQAVVGAGKNFVNGIVGLAELTAAGTLHLGGYAYDEFGAVAELAGFDAAAEYYNNRGTGLHGAAGGIDWQPFELTNHAQQGGAIIGTGVELATGIAGLARAGTMTVARTADEFATVGSATVNGARAIDRAQDYEAAIRGFYTGSSRADRTFELIVDGEVITRIADDIANIRGLDTAIDAKYVEDWAASLRNPNSPNGQQPWAVAEQDAMIAQARDYAAHFPGGAVYHTNSRDLAAHYSQVFRDAGIQNIEFVITPLL
ncbi:MAG: hypothetical protein AAGA87_07355 [Pseudomonadota bacterium]